MRSVVGISVLQGGEDVNAIEDLNVKGMVRNRHLARSISDASFGEFRRQLEYKAEGRVFVADRWFPSSKTCSACGSVLDELALSVREWTCPECGTTHDRDINAAVNILNYVRAGCSEITPTEIGAVRPVVEVGISKTALAPCELTVGG